jgi:hypothetical protein
VELSNAMVVATGTGLITWITVASLAKFQVSPANTARSVWLPTANPEVSKLPKNGPEGSLSRSTDLNTLSPP